MSDLAPARRIAPRPWMNAPGTRAVLAALEADGDVARFAGGAVRDAVLGRDAADVDIATTGRPEANVRLLRRAGLRVIPTGLAHGTVTAISDGRPYEVTTLRIDVESFGRRARVAFTEDWAADAARRDFTMNALYANPPGGSPRTTCASSASSAFMPGTVVARRTGPRSPPAPRARAASTACPGSGCSRSC